MAKSEQSPLLKLMEAGICPECGQIVPENNRIDSAGKVNSGFCGLDCYTVYHEIELAKRLRPAARRSGRHA
ncbi:MAG: hypothetical protein IIC57_06250 [Proteobacteria bacterium]|nr:hypothetical protein [Pseudomonadota bacterium]